MQSNTPKAMEMTHTLRKDLNGVMKRMSLLDTRLSALEKDSLSLTLARGLGTGEQSMA